MDIPEDGKHYSNVENDKYREKKRGRIYLIWAVRIVLFTVFVCLCFYLFDMKKVRDQIFLLISQPASLLLMVVLYGAAFLLRAFAWKKYLHDRVSIFVCLDGLFYSLLINHLLPLKVGDLVRAGFLVKVRHIPWQESLHSVIVLRSLDVLVLGAIAGVGAFFWGLDVSWRFLIVLFLLISISFAAGIKLVRKRGKALFQKHFSLMKQAMAGKNGGLIVICTVLSWVLESYVLLGVVRSLSMDLSVLKGVWVTSMTIAGQTFHFTPGGIGTYESVMSFSLAAVGMSWQNAYTAALITHGFKFAFSFLAGAYVLIKSPITWNELRRWITNKRRGVNSNDE